MGTFFVGQRVRIVDICDPRNASLLGMEARVTEVTVKLGWPMMGLDIKPIACEIGEDGGLIWYGWGAAQLEPILPEGHTQSIYSFQELMDKCREGVAA